VPLGSGVELSTARPTSLKRSNGSVQAVSFGFKFGKDGGSIQGAMLLVGWHLAGEANPNFFGSQKKTLCSRFSRLNITPRDNAGLLWPYLLDQFFESLAIPYTASVVPTPLRDSSAGIVASDCSGAASPASATWFPSGVR
jgi:hypothetical protein